MVKVYTQDHRAVISEVVRIPAPACQARVCALSTILLENVTKSYRVPGKWTFKHKFAYNLKPEDATLHETQSANPHNSHPISSISFIFLNVETEAHRGEVSIPGPPSQRG